VQKAIQLPLGRLNVLPIPLRNFAETTLQRSLPKEVLEIRSAVEQVLTRRQMPSA
jgi:hypothetical protein